MKLMFFPVTIIEELPHVLLYYNFTRKQNRYFLSPYEVEICKHGSQRTVCDIIRSSDFLCGLLGIDRRTIIKQTAPSLTPTSKDNGSFSNKLVTSSRRALSCSTVPENSDSTDLLSEMIEQRLDFKHRCMFYSTGPTSDLCGKYLILDF